MDEIASASPPVHAPQVSARPIAPRQPLRRFEVVVADAIAETPDTTTLVLAGDATFRDYRAGQFLTIDPKQFEPLGQFIAHFEEVKGKREMPRAYSLSSAPHEPHPAITVKEEQYVRGVTRYPPLLSPLLARGVLCGMRLQVTGYTGSYVLPDDVGARTDQLVHLVAGSGAVPNFSILKDALVRFSGLHHTFIDSNKTWNDVLFRGQLADLEARYPTRLRVVHALTRDPDFTEDPSVRHGRVSADLLQELIPEPKSCLVYVCGPAIGSAEKQAARERGEEPAPRFMESALCALDQIGVPRDRVKREAYG